MFHSPFSAGVDSSGRDQKIASARRGEKGDGRLEGWEWERVKKDEDDMR